MVGFIVSGEFGTVTVEANTVSEAAEIVARKYAGLDSDEICRDPFSFSVALASTPDRTKIFHCGMVP